MSFAGRVAVVASMGWLGAAAGAGAASWPAPVIGLLVTLCAVVVVSSAASMGRGR